MAGVDFRVDVAVGGDDVGPAIVVDVDEHGAPAEFVGVDAETGRIGYVVEGAVTVGVVEGGGVVGEIGLEDVQVAVAVVVGDRGAHAGLLAPILIEGNAGVGGAIGEGTVVIVAVQ